MTYLIFPAGDLIESSSVASRDGYAYARRLNGLACSSLLRVHATLSRRRAVDIHHRCLYRGTSWSTEALSAGPATPRAFITESGHGSPRRPRPPCLTLTDLYYCRLRCGLSLLVATVFHRCFWLPFSNIVRALPQHVSDVLTRRHPSFVLPRGAFNQSDRHSNVSLFTLGNQHFGGWYSRESLHSRRRVNGYVAGLSVCVIWYHRRIIIEDEYGRNSLIAMVSPAARWNRAMISTRKKCARVSMNCVYVCVCVCAHPWDPGPTVARCDRELTSWRAAAPRRRASGEPSAVKRAAGDPPPHFSPTLFSTTLTLPPSIRAICQPRGTVLCFYPCHLVVERAPSYAPQREIARNFRKCTAPRAIVNEFFGNRAGFCRKFTRFWRCVTEKHHLLIKY